MEYLNGNTDNITLWKVDNRIPTRSRIGAKNKTKIWIKKDGFKTRIIQAQN